MCHTGFLISGRKIFVCPNSRVVHDTIQGVSHKGADDAYTGKWLGLRLQKQTQFMNPAYDFDPAREKKKLKRELLKFTLRGYTKERIEQRKMNDYFFPVLQEIQDHRRQIIHVPHPFLDLRNE